MSWTVHDMAKIAADLDTSSLSDALDSVGIEGAILGIAARVEGARMFGPAFTVRYEPLLHRKAGEFHNAGNYIDRVPSGSVVVIAGGDDSWTNWGDILSLTAVRKGLSGTVLDGSARDLDAIRKLGYPLFSRNVFMRSGKNRSSIADIQKEVEISNILINPGDYIFGDDNGIVRIPQNNVHDVIERVMRIRDTEGKIREAVSNGMEVAKARDLFRYDQPWLTENQKTVMA